uniref:Uncharacterized protein n=1 Tax=Setaria viridis TaxID=4556 RepID=A0A4U6TSV2_SETVI|nr:translation initiation factor IF-2-like isoform X2 [Setaria viridis]TKW03819.1 hypothetical protein SEVIR_7G068200v2 [Setaria viridis]
MSGNMSSSPGYFLALSILVLAVTTNLQPHPGCAAAREFPGASSPAKHQAPVAVGTAAPAGTNGNDTTAPQVAVHGRSSPGGGEGQYMDLKAECATRARAGCNVPGGPKPRLPTIPPAVGGSPAGGSGGGWISKVVNGMRKRIKIPR